MLVSDAGIRGLVIVNKAKRIEFREGAQVWCESGTVLPTLARECVTRGLAGLEWAVGVPGTVGGAVVGNAGAHGRDVAADLLSATILNEVNEVAEWSKEASGSLLIGAARSSERRITQYADTSCWRRHFN